MRGVQALRFRLGGKGENRKKGDEKGKELCVNDNLS